MSYLLKISLLIVCMQLGAAEDSEISWVNKTAKEMPTWTVQQSVGAKIYVLASLGEKDAGLVSKDGKWCVYESLYYYDTTQIGVSKPKYNERISIVRIFSDHIQVVRTVDDASGMFDLNSDESRFVYVGTDDKGFYLKRLDLSTNAETIMINGADWVGHPAISADDKSLAFYLRNAKVNNQVVICNVTGAKIISKNVGNGWGLRWWGNVLSFYEDDLKTQVFFDPETGKRIAKKDLPLCDDIDKCRFGWPVVGLYHQTK